MDFLVLKTISAFIGGTPISFLTTLGKDVIIKTLTTTTNSIINLSKYMLYINKPYFTDVKLELEKMDINNGVSIIHELVKEQEKYENMNNSIKTSVLGVNDILIKIDNELQIIMDLMANHEKKYFKSFRTFNCDDNIKKIKCYDEILSKRYKLLKDCIMITHKDQTNLHTQDKCIMNDHTNNDNN